MARVQAHSFGHTRDGGNVTRYRLTVGGLAADVLDYGATLAALHAPARDGRSANVVLAADDVAGFERSPYFGSSVGRYANRIAAGRFSLDGRDYQLAANNGPNHLHGGPGGFSRRMWTAEPADDAVRLTLTSDDGDEGYPSRLDVAVTFSLTDAELRIDYEATNAGDLPTVVNLTNHAYWNLAGSGTVLDHVLTAACDRYLPVDDTLIPTGEVRDVAGTPFDFRRGQRVGERLGDVAGGYDHNLCVADHDGSLREVARLADPASGRTMAVSTTEPGVQFYSGNFLDGSGESLGYPKHAGLCLETQHWPDSPNRPAFPSTVLRPGQTYRSTTLHEFGVGR